MTQPPPGFASSEEKTWVLVSHFGGAAGTLISCGVLGFVAPLVAFLVKGNDSPTIRRHSLEALNFQLPLSIAAVALLILSNIATVLPGALEALVSIVFLVLLIGVIVFSIVFGVIAGIRANDGGEYVYPLGMTIVK